MDSKVRGHTYKIVKYSFRLDVRQNFFSNRVVDAWNELPQYVVDAKTVNSFKARSDISIIKYKLNNLMPRKIKHLEAGCLQVNLMSTSVHINQLKYTILYYTILYYIIYIKAARPVPDGEMFTLSVRHLVYAATSLDSVSDSICLAI